MCLGFPAHEAKQIAHAIQEIKKRECRCNMYRQIGEILQPNTLNRGGLARLYIPASFQDPYPKGPDPKLWKEDWTTVTDPEETAGHTCASNVRQYHRVANTMFAANPLATYLAPAYHSEGSNNILQGQLPSDMMLGQLLPELMLEQMTIWRHMPPHSIQVNTAKEDFFSC